PDGQPGFYFVRMRYVDNVDAIFAAERLARQQLDEDNAVMDGQTVQVRHSKLDMGQVDSIFDNDDSTLLRGLEANPLVLEIQFPAPRHASTLGLTTGTMDFTVKVEVTPPNNQAPRSSSTTYRGLPTDPHVDIALPGGDQPISRLRIEITNINEGDV